MAPIISRNTETVTFSLPPPQAQHLREVAREEERTVSELLREASACIWRSGSGA